MLEHDQGFIVEIDVASLVVTSAEPTMSVADREHTERLFRLPFPIPTPSVVPVPQDGAGTLNNMHFRVLYYPCSGYAFTMGSSDTRYDLGHERGRLG